MTMRSLLSPPRGPNMPHTPPRTRPSLSLSTELSPDDSFVSDTTTTSSTSFTPHGSRAFPLSAPTPANTFLGQASDPGLHVTSAFANDEELLYDPTGSLGPRPSLMSSRGSDHPVSFASHASSRLLPDSSSGYTTDSSVPFSTRPIPAPPMPLLGDSTRSLPSEPSTDLPTPSTGVVSFSKTTGGDLVEAVSRTSAGAGRVRDEDRDTARLRQLGYDPAFGREYTFWSSLAISWLNIGCLQGTIYAVSGAYSYGGPLMILIAWPLSGLFSICLTLTMSELASAYPVSGAMASWAWKVARGGVGGERGWGWLLGGFVLGGHLANVVLVTWEVAEIITGTMSLASNYVAKDWHLLLFFLATLLVCGAVQGTRWGRSHTFWLSSGAYGFTMWLVLVIALIVVNARRPKSRGMDTQYFNTTGFSSRPYVYLLGWEYTTIASGADASAHMAEETKNPSRNVPMAMVGSMFFTYVLGYISIALLLLAIDPADGQAVSQHKFAFGYILQHAINRQFAISMCCLILVVLLFQIMAQMQASSRFVFALARDNATPFAESIRYTNSAKQPIVANWVVVGLAAPFACLLVGSKNVLWSVLAVTASTLSYVGYGVPVALYLFSRINLQHEGRTSWSLRSFSRPVAAIGILYSLAVIIVQMFPGSVPVTAETISWSPVVLVGAGLISFGTWYFYGRKNYSGPIRALTKWETGVEIDLASTLNSRVRSSRPEHMSYGEEPEGTPRHPRGSPGTGGPFTPLTPLGEDRAGEGGLKLPVGAYFPEVTHTVTIESAHTLESGLHTGWTSGTESGWTSGTGGSSSGGSASTPTPTPTTTRRTM